MRISRIYTSQKLEPDLEAVLDREAGHYVFRVLKLREGDPLVLFNGDGSDYAAELLSNRRDHVQLRVTARLPALAESPLHVTLVQSVGKGDRMDYSLQKATELGVRAIQPLFTARTEVRLDARRLAKRVEHWTRVVISACEQCGRAMVPELLAPATLDEWLAEDGRPQSLVLEPLAEHSLSGFSPVGTEVAIVVGPEGGFSELETKQFQLAGLKPVSLGPRVLRTESAGPAALAVLQALHGDF